MEEKLGLTIRMLDNLIQKNICQIMRENSASEITYMNFWVINYVHQCHPREIYQKDIEQTLSINRATASKMLTTMEKKGLIARVPSAADGRLRKIVLQPAALHYHKRHKTIVETLEARMTEGISQEDIRVFLRVCGVIKENLEP